MSTTWKYFTKELRTQSKEERQQIVLKFLKEITDSGWEPFSVNEGSAEQTGYGVYGNVTILAVIESLPYKENPDGITTPRG